MSSTSGFYFAAEKLLRIYWNTIVIFNLKRRAGQPGRRAEVILT